MLDDRINELKNKYSPIRPEKNITVHVSQDKTEITGVEIVKQTMA
jgi:hypothetical protein